MSVGVAASVWCVTCGRAPQLTITVERGGALMHYGACWDHGSAVLDRVRHDIERIDARLRAGDQVHARGEIVCPPEVEPT